MELTRINRVRSYFIWLFGVEKMKVQPSFKKFKRETRKRIIKKTK